MTRPADHHMEQVFVVAKASFVNERFGSVTRRQRIPLPVSVAQELEAMGLVSIEKQPTAVQESAQPGPMDVGPEAPSSSSQADPVSETISSQKRKRGRPKKAGA